MGGINEFARSINTHIHIARPINERIRVSIWILISYSCVHGTLIIRLSRHATWRQPLRLLHHIDNDGFECPAPTRQRAHPRDEWWPNQNHSVSLRDHKCDWCCVSWREFTCKCLLWANFWLGLRYGMTVGWLVVVFTCQTSIRIPFAKISNGIPARISFMATSTCVKVLR